MADMRHGDEPTHETPEARADRYRIAAEQYHAVNQELRTEVERLRGAMESAVGVLAHGDIGSAALAILRQALDA